MISDAGRNLCFIFSIPRSGSTLLSLLLGSHSEILCPPEPWFLLKLAHLTELGNSENVYDEVVATIATKEFLQEDLFFEASRAFAVTAYNKQLQTAGKTIFLDKTPRYYHILPFIDTLFPEARKSWLKRNPLDVASSYKTTWNVSLKDMIEENFEGYSSDFAFGLFQLAEYFNSPSPLKIEVQYEELVKSPSETLHRICEFLDIKFEKRMLHFSQNTQTISQHNNSVVGDKNVLHTSELHTNSVEKWSGVLSLSEINQLVSLIGFDIFYKMSYGDVPDRLISLGVCPPQEEAALKFRNHIGELKIDKVRQLEHEIEYYKNSWSWKITTPLRSIALSLKWKSIKNSITNLYKRD